MQPFCNSAMVIAGSIGTFDCVGFAGLAALSQIYLVRPAIFRRVEFGANLRAKKRRGDQHALMPTQIADMAPKEARWFVRILRAVRCRSIRASGPRRPCDEQAMRCWAGRGRYRKRTGDALSTCLVMENGLNVIFPAAPPATVDSSASLNSPEVTEAVLQSAVVSTKSVIVYFPVVRRPDHPVVYAGETSR